MEKGGKFGERCISRPELLGGGMHGTRRANGMVVVVVAALVALIASHLSQSCTICSFCTIIVHVLQVAMSCEFRMLSSILKSEIM